jgi:hypothetical protein
MQGGYNPYGAPTAPPVIANPAQYGAYNPYQQPQPGQYQMPQGQFYPPPPGPPMFSAQAKERMRQLFIAFVVFGLLAAIIVVAFITITNSIQANQTSKGKQINSPKALTAPAATSTQPDSSATSSRTESNSPSATPSTEPAATYSGPNPEDLLKDAEGATGSVAKASLQIDAGKAYMQKKKNDDAYKCFFLAYQTQKDAKESNRDLRRTIDLLIDASPSNSEKKKYWTDLRAKL